MAVERDPVATNPELYRVVMETDRVRVLEYRDQPGDRTAPHGHPDSVMITLSSFRRRLIHGDRSAEVELAEAGPTGDPGADAPLGPSDGR